MIQQPINSKRGVCRDVVSPDFLICSRYAGPGRNAVECDSGRCASVISDGNTLDCCNTPCRACVEGLCGSRRCRSDIQPRDWYKPGSCLEG